MLFMISILFVSVVFWKMPSRYSDAVSQKLEELDGVIYLLIMEEVFSCKGLLKSSSNTDRVRPEFRVYSLLELTSFDQATNPFSVTSPSEFLHVLPSDVD